MYYAGTTHNKQFFWQKKYVFAKIKNVSSKIEKDYYKSLHYEAKARAHYLKFQQIDNEFAERFGTIDSVKDLCKAVYLFGKLAYQKFKNVVNLSDAHDVFPNRFREADRLYEYPKRHYELKMKYKNSVKCVHY